MRTKRIGEILKSERLARKTSLEELSQITRVRVDFLRALENNQFKKLPASPFVKGYIKIYSRVFDLDYEAMLALLRRDFKESAKGKLVPREFIKPILKRKRFWTPLTMMIIVLLTVFSGLFSYVGWQWYQFNKPPRLEIIKPEENSQVSSNIVVEGMTISDALVTVNNEPIAIKPDGSFQTELYLPHEGVTTITFTAKDRRGKSSTVTRTVYVRF